MTTLSVRRRRLLAQDVMSAPVVCVPPDVTPVQAWQVMRLADVRHIVVTIDDRCSGVVDDRTVLALWPMGPQAIGRTRVADFVRAPACSASPTTPLRAVARMMIDADVDAVPIVDPDGTVLGLVTRTDIVAVVASMADEPDEEHVCES